MADTILQKQILGGGGGGGGALASVSRAIIHDLLVAIISFATSFSP